MRGEVGLQETGGRVQKMRDEVKAQALKELEEEQFHEAVEKEKARIRQRVPLWHRVFPWVITIKRRS